MSMVSTASAPIGEDMLSRLRKTIMHKFPVTTEDFHTNYQTLFQDIIKPEEFGCQDMGLFVYKIELDHGIWQTKFKNDQLVIKPTRVSSQYLVVIIVFSLLTVFNV